MSAILNSRLLNASPRRRTRPNSTALRDPHTELRRDSSGKLTFTIHTRPKSHYFDFQGSKVVWLVRQGGCRSIERQHSDELSSDIYTVILKNHVRKNFKSAKTFYFRRIGETWVKTSL